MSTPFLTRSAAALLIFGLAACAGAPPRSDKAQARLPSNSPAALWTLAEVEVNVRPDARMFWFEATYGSSDHVADRASSVMRIALTQAAAALMNGGRHVTLEADINSFQGLSAAEVYTLGGHVSVGFDLVARDSVTGEVLASRKDIRIGKTIPGGLKLLIVPGSQRSLITGMVRDEASRWLARCCTTS